MGKKKESVTIVGPGSLGSSLATALPGAGYRLDEVVYRGDRERAEGLGKKVGARAVKFEAAEFRADVVWICVGDAEIGATAKRMTEREQWKGKVVLHASGALSSDELRVLRRKGAKVASAHPMMSFVRAAPGSFADVPFALEGDVEAMRVAAQIAKALGGVSFELKKKDKALYHALGAFASPLLIAHLSAAEKIGRKLGLKPEQTRKVIGPILRKTLSNYLDLGPAKAFSGPLVRGDAETVKRNINALERVRGAAEIYRALAKMAVSELPVREKRKIGKLIKE